MTEINEISELDNETYFVDVSNNECTTITQFDNIVFYNYTLSE